VKLLVSTNLEETYGSNEEIIFAGDWIKADINFEQNFKNRKYQIFNSVWENKSNLESFRPYLIELRNRLIQNLSDGLNSIHKTNNSIKYWKFLVDPWLKYYIEETYTRWKTIETITNEKEGFKFVYLDDLKDFPVPYDGYEFLLDIAFSDNYNQFLFQKIIKYFLEIKKIKNIELIYSNKKIKKIRSLELHIKPSKNNYILKFASFCFGKFLGKNKFYLDLNSIGLNFLLLNFKINQIPFKDYTFFTDKNYERLFTNKPVIDLSKRNKISFNFNKENNFEDFLSRNILNDIPACLIEDFFTIKSLVDNIPYKPKIIISDTRYDHDIIFKFWIAEKVKQNTKFLTTDHGGSFGSISAAINYAEEVSDISIRWHKPIKKNNVQLPALRLLNAKNARVKKDKRKYLLTLGFEVPKYPFHVFISPISGQSLYHINQLDAFYKNLNLKLKDSFLFKPYPRKDYGWNFEKRFKNIFKNKIIDSKQKSQVFFNKSKIIVCTYPKTSFCEAMISGPTILLYKSKYWKNTQEFQKLHDDLRNAKILFEDPKLASEHLNKVWDNIDDWWESENVKRVRSKFIKEAVLTELNPLNKWKKFLEKI